MSFEEGLKSVSIPAKASVADSQWRFMVQDNDGVERNTVSGGDCVGINQGKQSVVGAPVQVGVSGVSKVVLGFTASAAGVSCMSDITGRAVLATGTGARVLGTLQSTGVADDVVNILLDKAGELN